MSQNETQKKPNDIERTNERPTEKKEFICIYKTNTTIYNIIQKLIGIKNKSKQHKIHSNERICVCECVWVFCFFLHFSLPRSSQCLNMIYDIRPYRRLTHSHIHTIPQWNNQINTGTHTQWRTHWHLFAYHI